MKKSIYVVETVVTTTHEVFRQNVKATSAAKAMEKLNKKLTKLNRFDENGYKTYIVTGA